MLMNSIGLTDTILVAYRTRSQHRIEVSYQSCSRPPTYPTDPKRLLSTSTRTKASIFTNPPHRPTYVSNSYQHNCRQNQNHRASNEKDNQQVAPPG